jgi:hypothetical protein
VPSTCTVPYSVRLTGTTLTDPTTTPIDITESSTTQAASCTSRTRNPGQARRSNCP